MKDNDKLRQALLMNFTVGKSTKYQAGQVLGWGRRTTDKAVAEGKMPVIDGPKPTVLTAWLRKKLQTEPTSKSRRLGGRRPEHNR